MTCAMMLSEPCFLITTPVFDYPGQLQAVTGTVAVISSVPANSVKNAFCNLLFYLINRNGLLHIKINTIGQNTPDDSRQLIRQRNRGFQEPSTGLQPLQPNTQTVIALFHTAHYRPRTMNNESSQTPVAIFRYRRQALFSARTVLAGNQSTPRR